MDCEPGFPNRRPRQCCWASITCKLPLVLQDHSRYVGRKIALAPGVTGGAPDTTLKFRNIWMRRLNQ